MPNIKRILRADFIFSFFLYICNPKMPTNIIAGEYMYIKNRFMLLSPSSFKAIETDAKKT